MNPSDQDIDTAGTEADSDVPARPPGKGRALTDPTRHPQGAPPSEEGQAGGTTDPASRHQADDDGDAK